MLYIYIALGTSAAQAGSIHPICGKYPSPLKEIYSIANDAKIDIGNHRYIKTVVNNLATERVRKNYEIRIDLVNITKANGVKLTFILKRMGHPDSFEECFPNKYEINIVSKEIHSIVVDK